MKWLFYLVSLACIPMAGVAFAAMASDIQMILGVQFLALGVVSFGIGKILARQSLIAPTVATRNQENTD